ncbi:hypothetical protein K7J14_15495 [Treponema zuelzerae]|uniref:Uncharacterized protein n=1 Tax=Teretinema zuelzerae TaxID=156 RepID=A0AAE3EMP3_9SPIR|nr:hypothetical protein [Teretinema zuelzerae]MCD1656104.1 hypothetical protein [Teretinema zuelzerae]
MKRIIIFAIVFLCISPLFAEFRGFSWNSTRAEMQLKNGKELEIVKSSDAIFYGYDIKLNNQLYRAYFGYADDKLIRGMLLYTESILVPEQYVVEYESIYKLLIEKYGKPTTDDRTIIGDPDDVTLKAVALQNGRGIYMSTWFISDTKISIILRGGAGNLALRVVYEPNEIQEKAVQQSNEESKKEL